MKYTRFCDIPPLTRSGGYEVAVGLGFVNKQILDYVEWGLDLNPDFQRGHVWTEAQRVSFVEYLLRGGCEQNTIFFNCEGRNSGWTGNFVIVDGLQRLTSVLMFVRDELKVFESFWSEFTDGSPDSAKINLRFNVNDLPSRRDVLRWYLEINSGGTPHTVDELERVSNLLALEIDQESKKPNSTESDERGQPRVS